MEFTLLCSIYNSDVARWLGVCEEHWHDPEWTRYQMLDAEGSLRDGHQTG